jgi:hypothetical protein
MPTTLVFFSIIEFTNENIRKIVGNNGQNQDHAS